MELGGVEMKKTEKDNLESRELEMTSAEAGDALQTGAEEAVDSVEEKSASEEESFDPENNTETPSEPSDDRKKKSIDLKSSLNTKNVRYGSYSAALSAIVIVIAIVINLIASVLPSGLQSVDLSANKIYSIGKQTEKVLDQLDSKVSISVFSAKKDAQESLVKLLENYDDNKNITVEYVDPSLSPSVVQKYANLSQGSVVVKSGDKERTINADKIFVSDYSSYYTTGSMSTTFDGEGQITSAIQYVTSESTLKMYTMTGHGEAAMPSGVSELVDKQNIEVEELNLMAKGSIPDDCDVLFIYAPTSDYSGEEAGMVIDYLDQGGKVIAFECYTEEVLTNFQSILNAYGLQTENGIVLETANHYYQLPIYVLPQIASSEITEDLLSENLNILMPESLAMVENENGDATVTPLLQTSADAYLKTIVNGQLESTAKEDGDETGSFLLAALAEKASENSGSLVAISSPSLIDDSITQSFSLGNLDLFSSCLSSLVSQEGMETVSIEAKSMNPETITVSSLHSLIWAALLIVIIPVAVIVAGLVIWLGRRKK